MLWAILLASAFVPLTLAFSSLRRGFLSSQYSSLARAPSLLHAKPSLVVVSPPGGVGEVAAVKAASMGSNVMWFVVSNDKQKQQVVLSQYALEEVQTAGGRVQLAGSDASSLLLPVEDPNSAVQAVSAWCGASDAILCSFDGMDDALAKLAVNRRWSDNEEDPKTVWKNAIKVAAREAAKSVKGRKIAVLSAFEDESKSGDEDSEEGGGLGGLVGSLLGGKRPAIPSTLSRALDSNPQKVVKLRHGQLFGIPESSPDFSPLVGGPRRNPELCEEYNMRSIRVDPTLSLSGNVMMGSNTRSSRHSVGEAGAIIALGKVTAPASGLDVCVSSQRGSEAVDLEVWEQEFSRIAKMMSSSGGTQLFSAEFGSVPDVKRLADWLTTKWAPAVLRTYDIAAIRVGARPVYATRSEEGKVEVVWQQLVDFNSVTVGKMVIEVTDSGLVATRGPGDASKGFGSVSSKPLAGEDVLVRRLAEAASQAIEKGLAMKVRGVLLVSVHAVLICSNTPFFASLYDTILSHERQRSQKKYPRRIRWKLFQSLVFRAQKL